MSVNKELAQEYHNPLIKISNEGKSMLGLKINIWAADSAEVGSLSSKNRGIE